MENDFITRRECDAIIDRIDTDTKRIEDEDARQNKRIAQLEETVKKIESLTISIEKMSISVNNMASEIKRQGERLETIESKPGKRWETLVSDIIKLIVAAAVGFALARIGLG
jgi:cell division septum initiation protein DivIVA